MADVTIWDKVDRSLSRGVKTPVAAKTSDEPALKSPWTPRQRVIRDALGWIVWIYIPLKLFAIDLDRKAIEAINPRLVELLDYRFFFFLAVFALAVLAFRGKVVIWSAYIAIFPLIVLFWKLPRLLSKAQSWLPVIAVTNFISSAITSFRYHIVSKGIWLIAGVLILTSDAPVVVVPSMLIIGVVMLVAYFRTIRTALRPSEFLRVHEQAVARFPESKIVRQMTSFGDDLRSTDLETLSQEQLTQISNGLNFSLILNRAVYFWGYQLDRYRRSAVPFVFSIATYIGLFFFTVITLTLLNRGLLDVDPSAFTYDSPPTLMLLLYHSMSSLYLNGVSGIEPVSDWAIFLSIAGGFTGVILLGTVVANAVSSTIRRDDEAFAATIDGIKAQGEHLEQRLIAEYEVASIDDAIDRLARFETGLVGLISYLARQVPEDFYRRPSG